MPAGAKLDASPLKALLFVKSESKAAMTGRGSTYDLRIQCWLAADGIDPDEGVKTIVVPPPQVVANMRVGTIDAF